MSAGLDASPRTSISFVQRSGSRSLTAADLLRMFDQRRRVLALELSPDAGSAAGYDDLRIDWAAVAAVRPGDVITVTAMVRDIRVHSHQVDYVATAVSNGRGSRTRLVVLAEAYGWTLVKATESAAKPRPLHPAHSRPPSPH